MTMDPLLKQIHKVLDWKLLHNPMQAWLIALVSLLVLMLVLRVAKRLAIQRLSVIARRTTTQIDDAIVRAIQSTRLWLLFLVVFDLTLGNLKLPLQLTHGVGVIATLAAFLQVGLWLAAVFDFWLLRQRSRAMQTHVAAASSLSALGFVGRAALWAVILLLTLDNLGVNVTTLIASLGVGGIAIGFALQNILGDLFASLSIILDKPFVIGDFIGVDTFSGTVENIGIKTTRLRALDGELLVFSNGDLIKSRLHNYKHLHERRIVFAFGVLYDTPQEKLAIIPQMVREAVEAQTETRFDRAHFKSFGASSLDYEVVYWVLKPDYTVYMDAQQAINLTLIRRFREEGIDFAFPTRTLLHEGPLRVQLSAAASPPPAT
jgi:Small-conductance mechanosensitive channel